MAIYAIGDVHGEYDKLRRLLDQFDFSPENDQIWLTGDIVNRGSQSLEVCRFLQSLGKSAITVLGNHDVHLLTLAEGLYTQRRTDTLQPILDAPDCGEIIEWLRYRPLLHRAENRVLIHAGLLPQWSISKAIKLAKEAEKAFRKKGYRKFLSELYGNEPTRWHDELEGMARLRTIVNVFCRLRFCSPAGDIDFQHKGKPDRYPPGFMPWFEVPGRKNADHEIITGHWSALGLRVTTNHLGLDTGSCWGGALTAIRLNDRIVFHAF